MNVLRCAALLLFALLAGRKAQVLARFRPEGLFVTAKLRFLGLIPVKLQASLRAVYPLGWVLRVGGLPPRILKKRRKKGRMARFPLRALRVQRLEVSGAVGVSGEPAVTALLSGMLTALLCSAAAPLAKGGARVFIEPDFTRSVFALNVEGMFCLSPAKITAEALKKER